jgi:hypothetical protein
MDHCELCGCPSGDGGAAEAAGMWLCAACHGGRFGDRLAHRGVRLQCLVKHPHVQGSGGGQTTREVVGTIAYDLELRASFSPEDWLAKVGKLFQRELQTGDPTFDPIVYVRTDHPELLAHALRNEQLRAAIVHAVQVTGTAIMVERGRVTLYWQSIPSEQVPGTLRCVALVLHHLEKFALARGLRPRPQPVSYPDLRETIQFLESTQASLMGNLHGWPKSMCLRSATLDHLGDLARVHDLQADFKPLESLSLLDIHLVSGDLAPLAALRTLRTLELIDVPRARVLPPLDRLRRLEELTITRCPVTDLSPLEGLDQLRELSLQNTPVADLGPVASLSQLRRLDLRGTAVTDLAPILALRQLEIVCLQGLQIRTDQLNALRQANPRLQLDPY